MTLSASSPPDAHQGPHLEVHVVAHTHWDREWYHPVARFQQRLVALIDALLAAPVDVRRPFLLDGQAVVLEDYLAIRPERAALLARLLEDRSLEAGPWYVLADGLIPSGEALVRNLQAGRAILASLGAAAPNVAYCPDTFGHPAAMPLIAAGFGLTVGVVWRGLGGSGTPRSSVFRWHAPGGDALLLYHLPPDGYEVGSALPVDPETARVRWARLVADFATRDSLGVVLLPNGADHHALQPDLDQAISAMASASAPTVVRRSTLAAFASALESAAAGRVLPELRGELRNSYGYTWTLQGTFATRAAQKRANARAERLLVRDTEPWLVLAWLHGASSTRDVSVDGQLTLAQAPALLQHAWRTLLRAHPHDTLCGCSVDAVARGMNANVESASAQAAGLRDTALAMALHHDRVAARAMPINRAPHLVVRNRAVYARGGVAEVRLVQTLADVGVGPGSGSVPAANDTSASRSSMGIPSVRGVVVQPVSSRVLHERRESPQHYPDDDLVRVHYAVAWVPPVPALGVRTLDMTLDPASASVELPDSLQAVSCYADKGSIVLDNGLLRVIASHNGITIETEGRVLKSAFSVETTRDLGDAYTPSLRGHPEALELRDVRAGAMGPLRGSVTLCWSSGTGHSRVRVETTCVLDAMSPHLRIDVRGHNCRRDHRLRLRLHTDVSEPAIWADAAFGPVLRAPIDVPLDEQRDELVLPTMPLHRWVTAVNAQRGATVLSDGLAEAEVQSDGTIAVTLLRAIGELSRNDLPERPGHAGWPCIIPLAQSRGPFRARLGLRLHGAWNPHTLDQIEQSATDLLLPLVGDTWRDLQSPSEQNAGALLTGKGLQLSTATLATDGEGIVLRCVNVHDRESVGAFRLPDTDRMEFARARLDETLLESWRPVAGEIPIRVPARSVETLRVRRSAR